MKSLRLFCLLMAGWAGWVPGFAAYDLYVGEAVVDPMPADQPPPLERALNQVVERLTGRVGGNPVQLLELSPGQMQALELGREFRRVEIPLPDGRTRLERRLRVEFDPPALDRLLEQAGLPRWGSERPDLLLWIVVEGEGGAEFLEPDAALEYRLDQARFRHGFGLLLPILDGLDRVEVSQADVRGGFAGMALPAQRRYGADGVIMLDLRQTPGFWTGRWTWRIGDQEQSFQRSGADRAEAIELGLARIAESLAVRFAVRTESDSLQRLAVAGIERPAHYREVRDFLESLTGIESVRLVTATEQQLEFEVRSSVGGLRNRIDLTGPLEFVRHDVGRNVLYYRFTF